MEQTRVRLASGAGITRTSAPVRLEMPRTTSPFCMCDNGWSCRAVCGGEPSG
jgi:hypothetical protein